MTCKVHGHLPVARSGKEVELFYSQGDKRFRKKIWVERPTYFESIVVSVVNEVQSARPVSVSLPRSLREAWSTCRQISRHVRAALGKPHRELATLLDTRAAGPNNVSHLLVDIIPVILMCQQVIGPVIAVFEQLDPLFEEFLRKMGLNFICSRRRLAGLQAQVRGQRGLAVYDILSTFDMPKLSLAPEVYNGFEFPLVPSMDKVYMARRGSRALINHDKVEKILLPLGYKTIYMEDYSITEQLGIARTVRHVVAIHGAALGLLAVSHGLASIIEILPPHVFHVFFGVAFGSKCEKYVLLLSDYDEEIQNQGWDAVLEWKNRPFEVDVVALEQAVHDIQGS